MESFLYYEIGNNAVKDYLIVLGVILFAYLLKKIISKYLTDVLFIIFAKFNKTIPKSTFVSLLIQPLEKCLFIFISFSAIDSLNYPKTLSFLILKTPFSVILNSFVSAILIITFVWFCSRILDFIDIWLKSTITGSDPANTNARIVTFLIGLCKAMITIFGILLIIKFCFHIRIGNLITGLSLVGAALSLAARESIENLIATLIIFLDKPFRDGDIVKVHTITGAVEKIGLRSTGIRTDDSTLVYVPNKQMVDSSIDNYSKRIYMKGELRLALSISTSMDAIQTISTGIQQLISKEDRIAYTYVYLSETGQANNMLAVDYYTKTTIPTHEFNQFKGAINMSVAEYLATQAIVYSSNDVETVNVKQA